MEEAQFAGVVGPEYLELRTAVLRFRETPAPPRNANDMAGCLDHLSQTIDMLRVEHARRAAEFSETGEWDIRGSNSDVDWLRHNLRMSYSEAARAVGVGEQLNRLPAAAAALDRGEIGFGHLALMAQNAAFIDSHKTGTFDEAPLLKAARKESVSRFRRTCLNMRHVQDPKGVVADEVAALEKRELYFTPREDGTTTINLLVETPTAVMIQADITARAKRCGPDDTRTRARRDADALIERLLGQGAPQVEIIVSCTPATLLGLEAAPAADLEYTEPISGEMLQRLSCNARFTKMLLDENLIPVAAATTRRMPTKKERQAIDLVQKHCQGRGCHRPARECVPHHVLWYSKYRRTKTTEVLLLCPHHHWMVHEGGWDVALTDDGGVLFIPPFARGPTRMVAA